MLADRVGIINLGKLAAEGTPEELKRSIGSDVIVAKLDGNPDLACEAVRNLDAVGKVEAHGNELTISVTNGAAYVSAVAIALNECGVKVQEITLRTPSLDDVFLQVTGGRLQEETTLEAAAN